MRALRILALAAGGCLMSGVSTLAGTQFVNASFETPGVPVGSFSNFNTGADIGGWTVVGNQASVVNGTFSQNGFAFVAQDGVQWLDLTGLSSNSSEGVQQTLDTTPGANYAVKFSVGSTSDPGGIFGTSSTVILLVDGQPQQAATNSGGAGTSTQNWQEFTRTFTASGSTTTLAFLNADPSSDNNNGLDNVSLAQVSGPPPVIPLPTAAAQVLALVPLAGLLAMRRFSRRSRGKIMAFDLK